ncbi:oligosaccharide flippase family protein [bacterium]|nr:oligosaccharide flippase family protein [bacterium]
MKKFLQSGMWVFSSNLIIRIIALAVTPILARNFPKEDLSVFRSLQSIVLIVFTLLPLGTNLLYISEKKEDREKYWSLFILVTSITAIIAFPLLYLLTFRSYTNIPLMNLFVILIPISSFLKNIYTAKYTESIMFKAISMSILFRQMTLYSLIILFTYFTGRTIEFLIIAMLVSEAVEVFSLNWFGKSLRSFFRNFRQKITFDKKAKEFTLYTGGSNTIINLALQLPSVLVLSLLGKNLAVEFQMPLVLVSIPVSLLVMSVTSVMFPFLSNNRENDKMQKIVLNTQYIFYVTGLPICFFMFYFAEELSILLFNPEWKYVAYALKFLAIGTFFNILQNPLSQICLIKNRPKIAFYYAISLLAFRLIGLYIGFYTYGFMGSVVFFVLFDSLVRIIRISIDIRLISLTIGNYLDNIKFPLLVTMLVILIQIVGTFSNINNYLLFGAMSIVYLFGIYIFDKHRAYKLIFSLKNGMKNEG